MINTRDNNNLLVKSPRSVGVCLSYNDYSKLSIAGDLPPKFKVCIHPFSMVDLEFIIYCKKNPTGLNVG